MSDDEADEGHQRVRESHQRARQLRSAINLGDEHGSSHSASQSSRRSASTSAATASSSMDGIPEPKT